MKVFFYFIIFFFMWRSCIWNLRYINFNYYYYLIIGVSNVLSKSTHRSVNNILICFRLAPSRLSVLEANWLLVFNVTFFFLCCRSYYFWANCLYLGVFSVFGLPPKLGARASLELSFLLRTLRNYLSVSFSFCLFVLFVGNRFWIVPSTTG